MKVYCVWAEWTTDERDVIMSLEGIFKDENKAKEYIEEERKFNNLIDYSIRVEEVVE